ncbi:MAG: outer membrane protein [Planctomycetota bacterium]|jgi:hypothetical protein
MHNRWCAAVAALLLGAGSASAQEARFDPDPLAVLVVPADAQPVAPLAAPPGVSVDAFSGPLLFAGAGEVTSPFTLFSGVALRGVTVRDLFGREEFVIIAGGEPFALTGNNPITGTERLGMLAVTADLLYAWPPAGPVVPFLAVGAGFVHLIGDRGEQNAVVRLAAGLEWRVNPAFAFTLEASDLWFTADVLGRGVIQAWGVMAGVRWRF